MNSPEATISTFLIGVWFNVERNRFALQYDQLDFEIVQLILKSVKFGTNMTCIGKR